MTASLEWSVVPAPPGYLYESARWIPEAGAFQWVDILAATLTRWRPNDPHVESRSLGLEFATMALPLDGDRSLITSRNVLHEYSWASGCLKTLASWDFAPGVRFNDGSIAPDAAVYLGTMSMERRTTDGGLYRWGGHDQLVPVVRNVGISNGVGWSSVRQGYYVDSLVPKVHRLDVSASQPLETFVDLDPGDEPDGLTVTPEADVLVALWQGGRLARIAPTGERMPDISVPAQSPTSVAVGAGDDSLLLVTTASIELAQPATTYDGMVLVADRTEMRT